ncbi:MAG: protein phosphatase 2C domain-containing protein [Deltaproteobacteria bacterium]|jgi:serine/threonine protein phosphatase PrpC|nr:protein phosphatase 2C domain-containing protein [Deltaproteobacteria bacterium]
MTVIRLKQQLKDIITDYKKIDVNEFSANVNKLFSIAEEIYSNSISESKDSNYLVIKNPQQLFNNLKIMYNDFSSYAFEKNYDNLPKEDKDRNLSFFLVKKLTLHIRSNHVETNNHKVSDNSDFLDHDQYQQAVQPSQEPHKPQQPSQSGQQTVQSSLDTLKSQQPSQQDQQTVQPSLETHKSQQPSPQDQQAAQPSLETHKSQQLSQQDQQAVQSSPETNSSQQPSNQFVQLPQNEPVIELTLAYNGYNNNITHSEILAEVKDIIKEFPAIYSSYNEVINIKFTIDNTYSILNCSGNNFLINELGLSITHTNNTIKLSNIPKKDYDGALFFQVSISNYTNGEPKVFTKKMYIAPDPKSLWQNLPVEDYEGYDMPDEDTQALIIPNISKILIAASCRGRSHAHSGKPRDDSFAVNFNEPSGWNIVAVADGAGSAKYSRKGSKIACETVVTELMKTLSGDEFTVYMNEKKESLINWRNDFNKDIAASYLDVDNVYRKQFPFDPIFYKTVYLAYLNIYNEAKTRQTTPRDYHTTLLFIAFKKFDFGYFYGSFWIGDGAMAIYNLNNSNQVLVLGAPDSGEFAGQTRFLTMKEEIEENLVKKRTSFGFFEDFEAIILATDGITDPFFPSDASVASAEKWHEFWNNTLKEGSKENPGCPLIFDPQTSLKEKGQDLRKWLDFWSKGNHDDRTLLIIK